jgi:hypothetical protein
VGIGDQDFQGGISFELNLAWERLIILTLHKTDSSGSLVKNHLLLEGHSVSSASNASKLAELRAKTDRQLSILVRKELERALVLANVAATKESKLYEQAETAYKRLKVLLPRIGGMSRDERALMEANLKELRAALDWGSAQRIQRHATFVA